MSSSESNDESNVTLYNCRLCPGASFTAAEREIHRRVHMRNPIDHNHKARPGPKSRRVRVPSPPGTDSTIFTTEPRRSVPIHSRRGETDEDGLPQKKNKPGPKSKGQPGRRKKIRSRKNYREDVDTTVKFTGA